MRFFVLFLLAMQIGFTTEFKMEILSQRPRLFLIENFLSSEECDYLIEHATPQLTPSTVVSNVNGSNELHPARTSKGMFYPTRSFDPMLIRIEQRIADLTRIPVENGEGLQVLLYATGGEYRPHYDCFDRSTPGGQVCLQRGGQRVATVIMYLNTVEDGGETIFPRANIKVQPQKGNAILFYNCTPEGLEDFMSLHGGAPVKSKEKWIATKWLREREFE